MTNIYGQHLTLDGYGASPAALSDLALIYDFLDRLPLLINMEKIGPPQLAVFKNAGNAGITGAILIVTSHISIHTYSLKGCLFLDVFSCRRFSAELVVKTVTETFGIERSEISVMDRGREFPARNLYGPEIKAL